MRQRRAPLAPGAARACRRAAAGLAALSLAACAVAPTAVPPSAVSLPTAWSDAVPAGPGATTPLAAWWRRFDDPLLVALIDEAHPP